MIGEVTGAAFLVFSVRSSSARGGIRHGVMGSASSSYFSEGRVGRHGLDGSSCRVLWSASAGERVEGSFIALDSGRSLAHVCGWDGGVVRSDGVLSWRGAGRGGLVNGCRFGCHREAERDAGFVIFGRHLVPL